MDRVVLKLRLLPSLVARLKGLHPAYGEVSRVVGELVETYVETLKKREASRNNDDKV